MLDMLITMWYTTHTLRDGSDVNSIGDKPHSSVWRITEIVVEKMHSFSIALF